MCNVPVNNFSCLDGATASWVLPVLFFFFFGGGGGVNMSCSRTQHGDPSGDFRLCEIILFSSFVLIFVLSHDVDNIQGLR